MKSHLDELEEIQRKKMIEMLKQAGSKQPHDYPNAPVEVGDQTFKAFISKYPLTVVDCWAAWCGPCRMIAPIIEELAKDYAGKVVFGKLNVDENPSTAVEFDIMSIPTLLIIKEGHLIDIIIGAVPKIHIENKLKALIN